MARILLINPNTSQVTTDMMTAIAQTAMPPGMSVTGVTARHGVPLIQDSVALRATEPEVIAAAMSAEQGIVGIVVAAFGDPAVVILRRTLTIPVVGIAESAIIEAAAGNRRFGIATTTPGLIELIDARVGECGLTHLYAGTRVTPGEPTTWLADPERLAAELTKVALRCLEEDGAEAVVIGGGPLGNAATAIAKRLSMPVIAPIPAAARRLLATITLA